MTPKKIAVLGGGNGAHTMAAELALKGHTVNMYDMPQFKDGLKKVFETKTIRLQGNIPELQGPVTLNMVTDNIAQAVEGCHYICIVAPAFSHAGYAKLLKGHLHKDQIVITYPGAFSALVLKKEFGDEDCPVFADANNLPYDARLVEKGSDTVNVFGRNPINIAFLPAEKGPELIDEMREDLFPFEKIYTDVLECGLAIVNPDWHAGPGLVLWMPGHVGVYVGDGEVIECTRRIIGGEGYGLVGGVVKTHISDVAWEKWLEYPGIRYEP